MRFLKTYRIFFIISSMFIITIFSFGTVREMGCGGEESGIQSNNDIPAVNEEVIDEGTYSAEEVRNYKIGHNNPKEERKITQNIQQDNHILSLGNISNDNLCKKPYLILHNMKYRVPTPSYIENNKLYLESLPIDGIAVYLANSDPTGKYIYNTISHKIMSNESVSYDTIYELLKPLKGMKIQLIKNSFVIVFGNKAADFFDDWKTPIQNFKNLSKALKEVGLAGIFFDNETNLSTEEWRDYSENLKYYNEKTLEQYQYQTRLRGFEIMRALVSEYPQIEVITLHGPYVSETKAPPKLFPQWQSYNELSEPLFIGFMEGKGKFTQNIDGGELYNLRTLKEFQEAYIWRKYTIADASVNSTIIPDSLKALWPEKSNISFGVYDQPFGGAPMDAGIMQTTITNAMKSADKYTWLYFERTTLLIPTAAKSPWTKEWLEAIDNGRKAAQSVCK